MACDSTLSVLQYSIIVDSLCFYSLIEFPGHFHAMYVSLLTQKVLHILCVVSDCLFCVVINVIVICFITCASQRTSDAFTF